MPNSALPGQSGECDDASGDKRTALAISDLRGGGAERSTLGIARGLIAWSYAVDMVLFNDANAYPDEATTALDPATEAGIVATVRRLAGKVTVLSISHQLAMRRAADLVYSLKNSRAVLEHTDGRPTVEIAGASRR